MSSNAAPSLDITLTILRAAAEETRLRILALLADGELSVSDLTDILGQSQPRISRHLKLLVEAGLVERHREGAWAFFRLTDRGAAAQILRPMLDGLNRADTLLLDDRTRLEAVRAPTLAGRAGLLLAPRPRVGPPAVPACSRACGRGCRA